MAIFARSFACGRGDGTPWWRFGGWRGCCCCAPRYFVVLATTTMSLLTGSIYFGWVALAAMMLKSESFSSMCPMDAKGNFINDGRAIGQLAICDAQEAAVQHLYSITLFTMTSASLFAGALMDSLGPRFTAVLGYCLNILANICLATSQWFGDVLLYIGFALLGAATDTAFLPILSISRLFPHHSGFVICVLGSAASASFGVPPILEAMADRMKLQQPLNILWGYALAGPGVCLFLTFLFLPSTGFLDEATDAEASPSQHRYEELLDIAERDAANGDGTKPVDTAVAHTQAWPYIFSLEYFLVAVYFSVFSSAVVFYQEASSRYFSPSLVEALELALPFSFVPCAALGWVADMWGIIAAMTIATTNGLMAYACALSGKEWLGYVSVFCFTNFISIFTSQICVYTQRRFPPHHFGKVIGSLQLIGGALALFCNPIYSAVAVSHLVSLAFVTKTLIGLLAAQYIWLVFLWRLQNGEQRPREEPFMDASLQLMK